jgi:membrane-associated phospholipid phosphatase
MDSCLWCVVGLFTGYIGPLAAQASGEGGWALSRARPALLGSREAVRIGATLTVALLADGNIREDVQEVRSPSTNGIARIGNALGSPKYVVPALGAVWLASRVTSDQAIGRAAIHAGEAGLLASGISGVIKFGLGRVRPLDGADPDRFRPLNGNGAFPSGHTTLAFAVATALARDTPDRWTDIGLYGLASLTALSRLNDDRHWTSDVIAGAVIGYLVGRQVVPGRAPAGSGGAYVLVTPRRIGFSTAF